MRPVPVGLTLRRLASEIAGRHILPKLYLEFEPVQLGFGVKGGCEAAVHALRFFLTNGQPDVLLKIYIENAFNSANRDTLRTELKQNCYIVLMNCPRK